MFQPSQTAKNRSLEDIYELSKVYTWIRELNPKNLVALQFPNELLSDACEVSRKIRQNCETQTIILGENNFGSTCCADEHTALTIGADCIVHFGHTCLSPHVSLPVLYITGNRELSTETLLQVLNKLLIEEKGNIFIACDVIYHNSLVQIIKQFDENKSRIILSNQTTPLALVGNDLNHKLEDQFIFLYIGANMSLATIPMLKQYASKYFIFDPLHSELKELTSLRSLLTRKRYCLVEKIKASQLIGILVGTLEGENCLKIIQKIKEMIHSANKRSCLIVIGKITPSKLANFPEVDCFVMVACPENTLHDSKEFLCPIVTPFELAVALDFKEWTGNIEVDYRILMKELPDIEKVSDSIDSLSLQINSNEVSCKGNPDKELSLISKSSPLCIEVGRFANRGLHAWRGLEPGVHETSVQKAESGRSGLAMRYSTVGDMQHDSSGNTASQIPET